MIAQEKGGPWSLPAGWKWVRLEAVATITSGLSYEKSQLVRGPRADACRVIRSGNIQNGRIVTGVQDVYLPLAAVPPEQLVRQHDVLLVASTGSQKSMGKAGIVTELPESCSFGAFLFLLRPREGVDKRYFARFFLTAYFRRLTVDLARGSSINNLKRAGLMNLLFPLPPLAEQGRIADRLDMLFEKLETAKRLIEAGSAYGEQARTSLLAEAFAGRFSPLSAQWPVVTLGELLQLGTGEALPTSRMNPAGTIPVYGGNGVSGFHQEGNCERETIVIGRVGTNCGTVYVTPPRAWITDNALIVRFDHNRLHLRFLYYALLHLQLHQYSNSSAQPVLSGKTIYPLSLHLPSLFEQQQLAELLDARLERMEEACRHMSDTDVEQIGQLLLQSAFTGGLVARKSCS